MQIQEQAFLQGRGFVFWHYFTQPVNSIYPYPDSQASPNPYVPSPSTSASYDAIYAQRMLFLVSLNINEYNNGTLNLTSSDPLAPSSFVANLFAHDSDAQRGARAIRKLRKLMNSNWNGTAVEITPGANLDSDEQLIPWIRKNAVSFCHYYATHPMGTDPSAPCDARMKLRKVTGLRIVGPASIPEKPIFPGMQQLATLLGEKGTDLILEDHGFPVSCTH